MHCTRLISRPLQRNKIFLFFHRAPKSRKHASSCEKRTSSLDLEATRPSATTGTLELATLGNNMGLLVLVGAHAEVLDGLTGVLGTTENKGVAASGSTESKLIQSDGLTAGGDNAGAGGGSEAESRNRDIGERKETVVVGDGSDNNDGALLALLVDVGNNAREGHRRTVDLGHEETAENNLVEGSVGTACTGALVKSVRLR